MKTAIAENLTFYMAAERGLAKFTDIFDGASKSFEDFQFDITNKLTYTAMAGKSDAGRNAATAMPINLDRGGKMSVDESKNLMFAGTEEEKGKAKCGTACSTRCSRCTR